MARQPKTNTNIAGYEYYRTRLTIGYDAKGKPIIKTFYGKSKTEAESKKREYEKALNDGVNPDLSSQTLERAMYTWLWNIEKYSGNKSSSFERYESIYRNYIEGTKIGHLIMSDIKKLAIQKYYNELINAGKSYSVVESVNKLLNKFFGYAEIEGYVVKSPMKGLKVPKSNEDDIDDEDREIETFTKDEINKIIAAAGNTKIRYIIMFALLTGARLGEILALEKTDIIDNTVKINKSIRNVKIFDEGEKYHYEQKVTKPKTKNSVREVPIPKTLMDELKKLSILVKEERLKLGPAYNENNLLFPSQTGTYMDAKNVRLSWTRTLKRAGIPYKKFHSLRHTYATQLLENGASLLTVSRLLGHSSVKTTEIYAHVLDDTKQKTVETLNSLFI